jgi:hypothetical protein
MQDVQSERQVGVRQRQAHRKVETGSRQTGRQMRQAGRVGIGLSVADPDPPVFGPPGSGSISQKYGSGSFFH